MDFPTFLRSLPRDCHLAAAIQDRIRARAQEDERAAKRRFDRAMLGCCPCGLAPGDAYCPICEGAMSHGAPPPAPPNLTIGRYLRDQGKTLTEIAEIERVFVGAARRLIAAGAARSVGEVLAGLLGVMLATETPEERARREANGRAKHRAAIREVVATIAPTPNVDGAPLAGMAPRAPNRHERRREMSRRWRR
jgi:hypothetical protein